VGGIELSGDGLVFSSAKPAQQAGSIALRCVNRRDVGVRGTWAFGRTVVEAVLARMDETPEAPVAVNGRSLMFEAAPEEIVTVLVR
jgi:hypothetical protein